MKKLVLVLAGVIGACSAMAQRTCGTDHYTQMQELANPGLKEKRALLEEQIAVFSENETSRRGGKTVVTIPVVVHVVYGNAAENISDALIFNQINRLNQDYRKQNTDAGLVPSIYSGLASDVEIEFCLAVRDPDGNPTTGITRTPTSVSSFTDDDKIKNNATGGKAAWNSSKYLNLWVGDLGWFLLGYAQFPGGPASTDGVVIHYGTLPGGSMAPFNKGRTATHEVGHWLNLRHIWGDSNCGNDLVADTPPQSGPNYECPTFPQMSCGNQGDMSMNYMDYTDDGCMYMFTAGQKTRVQATINASRSGLLTSMGCVPVTLPAIDAALTTIVSPGATVAAGALAPVVTLKNGGQNALTSANINYTINAGNPVTYQWTGNLASQATANVTLPATNVTTGSHSITVTVSNPNNGTDANSNNNTSSKTFSVTNGLTQSFEGGIFPPTNYQLSGNNPNYKWQLTAAAAHTGTSSMYVNNYNINVPGARADLTLPNIDLTAFSSAELTFEVAHKMYSQMTSDPDSLEVLISTNSGQSFTSVYKKGGTMLTTGSGAAAITAAFVPTSASDWRKETINLAPFLSGTNAIIKIRAINRYGNNLYVDDVLIDGAPAVGATEAITAQQVGLYPNPSTGMITIVASDVTAGNASLEVTDMLGRIVTAKTGLSLSADGTKINLSNLTNGVYVARISTGNGIITQRFVISK